MVINMSQQDYLMVNQATNIVDNVCVWDGNTETWQPPPGYLMLVDSTTPALIWVFDKTLEDWVLTPEMGAGCIGFSWNGSECVTNEPKPAKPIQPLVEGAQPL